MTKAAASKTFIIDSFSGKYRLTIVPKTSISVSRLNLTIDRNTVISESPVRTFFIGDEAEYDSYNLSYTGKIVSITEKTVTIDPKYSSQKKRLGLDTFCWRNWNFDAEETARQNAETSYYI